MKEMIKRDLSIEQFPILPEEARLIFHHEPYRLKKLHELSQENPMVCMLDGEVDLAGKACVDHVGEIQNISIDKNPSLDPISMNDLYYGQRIYGNIA